MKYLEIVELHNCLYIKSDAQLPFPFTIVVNSIKYESDIWRLGNDGETHYHLLKVTK